MAKGLDAANDRFRAAQLMCLVAAHGRKSTSSSLVAGLYLFNVQGIFLADLRLEAFDVAEVLL
jgi:hypothetical protein